MDAFLVHTWAVTVTGAPKPWAIQFVEDQEASARCWYARTHSEFIMRKACGLVVHAPALKV